MQPPWSTATSMITEPPRISPTSSRDTRTGARAPGVSTAPTTVYPNQTGITVTVVIANTGEASATVASAASWLTFTSGGDVSGDYTVTPAGGNPTSIAGGGNASFDFTVDVAGGATLGVVDLDAQASGTDDNDSSALNASGASSPDSWTGTQRWRSCVRGWRTRRGRRSVITSNTMRMYCAITASRWRASPGTRCWNPMC